MTDWRSAAKAPCVGVVLAGAIVLAGCSSLGGITGALAGITSGTATANPAVGMAAGIGVKAGVDESVNAVLRYWSHEEQSRIAALIGATPVGQRRPWQVRHEIAYDNKQGELVVLRAFATPLAACKEAAFSVDGVGAGPSNAQGSHFITTVCQGIDGWKWAVAEPAVARWGALQ